MFKNLKKKIKSLIKHNNSKNINYIENRYGRHLRITNDEYRQDLTSWQVPAIKKHFGNLSDKIFIDIGAGDIVLGEKLELLGYPKIFYAQDLQIASLNSGIKRLKQSNINTEIFITMASENFDFDLIPDETIDFAFSNSLFSHLSINSIIQCLKKLSPKMKSGGRYLTSMIVCPSEFETRPFDWSFLNKKYTKIISYPTKDPFHYTSEIISQISSFNTGFQVIKIHDDYGHPFQKLVEFKKTY